MGYEQNRGQRSSYGAVPIGRITPNIGGLNRSPGAKDSLTKRRTFQPVRRSSFDVSDRRAQVFRPIAGGGVAAGLKWKDKLVQTAQEFDDTNKEFGARLGPIGDSGVRVLDTLLTRCCDFKTGRCEPSIDTIMRYTRYARATVVNALARLKRHGFIDWVRRTRRIDNERGEGPQVAQETNAYFFELTKLPGRVYERFKQLLGGRAAIKEAQRRKQANQAREKALLATSPSKLGSALAGECDPELARVLDRLGAAIEANEEESEGRSEDDCASSVNEQNPSSVSKNE